MVSAIYTTCLAASMVMSWSGLSHAHLIMKSPVPYGIDTLNNSPLVDIAIGSSTSDYPCKQRTGVYAISQMNNMTVGSPQTLSFTGSASHGGGTCQLAVSLDEEPTANSTWKLIQVYEGGCPITADGNDGTDDFTFEIPQNFPNGQATLAWTWYNRVGNREIYMNCAPIIVSGGADDDDYYNTLPDMYIINLPTTECSTIETSNQIIPYPGQFVLTGDTADPLSSATGTACAAAAAAQTQGVSGYQTAIVSNDAAVITGAASGSDTGAATTATAATTQNDGLYSQAATTSAASTTSLSTTASSGFMTVTTASALSLVVTAPATNTTSLLPSTSAAASTSTNTTTSYSSDSSTNSTASGSATCTEDGTLICNGATEFGLCDNGEVVWQAVAAGTTCSDGAILKRNVLGRSQQLGHWFAALF